MADGVLLSAGLCLDYARTCLAQAEDGARAAGRDPATLRRAGFIYFSVSSDGRAAVEDMRRKLAFLFRSPNHAANIRASGVPIDHEGIMEAFKRRDMDTAARRVPDEAIEAFTAAGTPRECRDRLEKFLAIGLDEPVIEVRGMPADRALALDLLREFSGR